MIQRDGVCLPVSTLYHAVLFIFHCQAHTRALGFSFFASASAGASLAFCVEDGGAAAPRSFSRDAPAGAGILPANAGGIDVAWGGLHVARAESTLSNTLAPAFCRVFI